MSEIMEVPFPLAASRFLMSFLTLNISICWSSSSFDDMVAVTVVGTVVAVSVPGEVARKESVALTHWFNYCKILVRPIILFRALRPSCL